MARPSNPGLADKMMHATAAIIEARGLDELTMRAVARAIGYSATTIYLYFDNKEDLLNQTVIHAFGWLSDALAAAIGTGTDDLTAVARIRSRARAYVLWALEHKGMYRLMFQHDTIRPLDSETGSVQPRTLRESELLIAEAIAAGQLPASLDAAVMARINWAGLHGIVSLALAGRLFGAPDDIGMEQVESQAIELSRQFVDAWLGGRA